MVGVSCDGPVTCPGCVPAFHPVTTGMDSITMMEKEEVKER